MTTIRERSTAALAEALRSLGDRYPIFRQSPSGGDLGGEVWYEHGQLGTAILDASPTLARRLDFATAWDEAVEAGDGREPSLFPTDDGTWNAWSGNLMRPRECVRGSGQTKVVALVALTEALLERAR